MSTLAIKDGTGTAQALKVATDGASLIMGHVPDWSGLTQTITALTGLAGTATPFIIAPAVAGKRTMLYALSWFGLAAGVPGEVLSSDVIFANVLKSTSPADILHQDIMRVTDLTRFDPKRIERRQFFPPIVNPTVNTAIYLNTGMLDVGGADVLLTRTYTSFAITAWSLAI